MAMVLTDCLFMAVCPNETTKAQVATRRLSLDMDLASCRCDMVHVVVVLVVVGVAMEEEGFSLLELLSRKDVVVVGKNMGGKDSDPTLSAYMRIVKKINLAPAEILNEISKAEKGCANALRYLHRNNPSIRFEPAAVMRTNMMLR